MAIAHFTFAQFVFAADAEKEPAAEDRKANCQIARNAAEFVEGGLERLNEIVDLDKAVDKGSAACQRCGRGLRRAAKAAADLTLALFANVDGRTGGKLTAAKDRVLGFAQATDLAVTGKIGGTRVGNGYDWSKAKMFGLYGIFQGAIYPKSE